MPEAPVKVMQESGRGHLYARAVRGHGQRTYQSRWPSNLESLLIWYRL